MDRESTVYMRLLQLDRWCNIIDESLQNQNKTTTTTKLNWQNQNKNKKKVSQNRISLSFERILCSRYNINPEGHMNFHLRQYKSSVFGVIHSLWNVCTRLITFTNAYPLLSFPSNWHVQWVYRKKKRNTYPTTKRNKCKHELEFTGAHIATKAIQASRDPRIMAHQMK